MSKSLADTVNVFKVVIRVLYIDIYRWIIHSGSWLQGTRGASVKIAQPLQEEMTKRKMFWQVRHISPLRQSISSVFADLGVSALWRATEGDCRRVGSIWMGTRVQGAMDSFSSLTLIGSGIICLLASIVFFAADTQPVTITIVCGMIISINGSWMVAGLQQQVSIWGHRWMVGNAHLKWFYSLSNYTSQYSEALSVAMGRQRFPFLDQMARNLAAEEMTSQVG
jgi:hypothetical protein